MWEFIQTVWHYTLYYPLINILIAIYAFFEVTIGLTGGLGFAVIVLAIAIRLLMIPMSKKQTDMTVKMADLKPKLDELQKKYKHNPEQLAKEQIKLYKEVGYNPLGCLWNFLPQILVFVALFGVINAVTSNDLNGVHPALLKYALEGAKELPAEAFRFATLDLSENFSSSVKETGSWFGSVSYLIIALLAGFAQFIAVKMSEYMQKGLPKKKVKKSKGDEPMAPEEMQAQMMKTMNIMFPLMTFFMALSTPSVIGLYWFVQTIMQVIVNFITHKEKTQRAVELFKKDMTESPIFGRFFVKKV
jgi:YidC/Oxa1 family membrane protein insertase